MGSRPAGVPGYHDENWHRAPGRERENVIKVRPDYFIMFIFDGLFRSAKPNGSICLLVK